MFFVSSLVGLSLAIVGLALAIDVGPKDELAATAGLVCLAVFGTWSVFGVVFGCRELQKGREPIVLADPRGHRIAGMASAERARAIVREIAECYGAHHIAKQLDGIRSDRIANARTRFAKEMTDDETLLVLVDSSFLRNGKAGFLLTDRRLYSCWLSRPIDLRDVESVAYRSPDAMAAWLVLFIAVVAVMCFPPLVLVTLPLAFGKNAKIKGALDVNGRGIYRGGKNLASGFWLEVLPALAEVAKRVAAEHCIRSIEVVSSGEVELEIPAPSWKTAEQTLRSLNGTTILSLRCWAGTPNESTGLEVLGGKSGYVLRELGGNWTYYDPLADDMEVNVCDDICFPAYSVCFDLKRVIEIVRGFAETGAFD